MVIRIHGHHLLLGLRLNNYHKYQVSLYSRQMEFVKSGKAVVKYLLDNKQGGVDF